MAGSTSTLRVAGMPSGYPAEIDANLKIRWVDNLVTNMSEDSTQFLKWAGGPSSFTFTNPKIEWIEDDQFGRRPTHTGLTNAADTSFVVTGQAHQFPVGTLFYHVSSGEIARVIAIVDADTLTLQRDVPGAVSEGAWLSTDEVIVSGHAMSEDDNWTFRPSGVLSMLYNYAQITHTAVQASYRRVATGFYGNLQGTDLDYQSAGAVAFEYVAMEEALVFGYRYEGSTANRPAMTGGLAFYITDANGAEVNDLNSADLTRTDIEDTLQNLWYSVGPDKMARTLVGSAFAQRRVDSFWENSERLTAGYTGVPGVHIQAFRTAFGVIEVMMHTATAKNQAYLLNKQNIRMGNYAGLGRPHLLAFPQPSTQGPRIQRAFYADIGIEIKGVQGMALFTDFATS